MNLRKLPTAFLALCIDVAEILWKRIIAPVVVVAVVVLLITAIAPYISTDPTKIWYAVKNGVHADHVTVEKEPHDCEFSTAPLGNKQCHYEAREFVLTDEKTPDRDAVRQVVVTYEKVND
jgi:hypothetical protein